MKHFIISVKLLLIVVMPFLLYGCLVGSFEVIKLNDKFSTTNEPLGYQGKNNRLSSKSSQGGGHLDSKGVYLEPYVYKDRQTNNVTSIGFYIVHYNFDVISGFNPIKEIIFLTDKNERIVLKVKASNSDFNVGSWNTISKEFNTTFSESGISDISIEDYLKIAKAITLDVKIVGGKRDQTYSPNDISSSFCKNLLTFYDLYVK